MEGDEMKALNFIRRCLMKKNEKIRELSFKIKKLQAENEVLKWKCNDIKRSDGSQERNSSDEQYYSGINTNTTNNSETETGNFTALETFPIKSEVHDDFSGTESGIEFLRDTRATDAGGGGQLCLPDPQPRTSSHMDTGSFDTEQVAGDAIESNALGETEPVADTSFDGQASTLSDAGEGIPSTLSPSMLLAAAASREASASQAGASSQVNRCRFCNRAFAAPSQLRIHMRTHTGERPYSCPFCDYRCAQRGNLNIHIKRVHQQDRSPGGRSLQLFPQKQAEANAMLMAGLQQASAMVGLPQPLASLQPSTTMAAGLQQSSPLASMQPTTTIAGFPQSTGLQQATTPLASLQQVSAMAGLQQPAEPTRQQQQHPGLPPLASLNPARLNPNPIDAPPSVAESRQVGAPSSATELPPPTTMAGLWGLDPQDLQAGRPPSGSPAQQIKSPQSASWSNSSLDRAESNGPPSNLDAERVDSDTSNGPPTKKQKPDDSPANNGSSMSVGPPVFPGAPAPSEEFLIGDSGASGTTAVRDG